MPSAIIVEIQTHPLFKKKIFKDSYSFESDLKYITYIAQKQEISNFLSFNLHGKKGKNEQML